MKNLNERQNALKKKNKNPIYEEINNQRVGAPAGRVYVFAFLNFNNILIKVGHSTILKFAAPSEEFQDLFIFPFPNLDLAVAFEKKVRYYYDNLKKDLIDLFDSCESKD